MRPTWVERSAQLAIIALAVWVLFGILVELDSVVTTGPEKISGIAFRIAIAATVTTFVLWLIARPRS